LILGLFGAAAHVYIGERQPQRSQMKYEYKVVELQITKDIGKTLNELGKDKWELLAVIAIASDTQRYFFKRSI
jgi:hypothetical protein